MMRGQWIKAALLIGLGLAVPVGAAQDSWVSLCNGKNLDGWEQRNGTATYRVEDGCIAGKTGEGSPNSFLCTVKEYGNFELKFEVKVDDQLNSGVQIRSKSKDNKKEGRVHGPQVEIAVGNAAGYIYGEALPGAGWIGQSPKGAPVFKNGEWNKFFVKAQGKSIKTWINGVPIADITDDKSNMPVGFIGLQVHGIKKGTGPYEVRWRNLFIKELR